MSASGNEPHPHIAALCLGSNIEPVSNMRLAVDKLRQRTTLLAISTCWETAAIGSSGPAFLNLGVTIATPLLPAALKETLIHPIEQELGRVRGADKYAPRTIDLDIILFDGNVLDADLWKRNYLALIFAELHPELIHPETGETIQQVADRMRTHSAAILHPELRFTNSQQQTD